MHVSRQACWAEQLRSKTGLHFFPTGSQWGGSSSHWVWNLYWVGREWASLGVSSLESVRFQNTRLPLCFVHSPSVPAVLCHMKCCFPFFHSLQLQAFQVSPASLLAEVPTSFRILFVCIFSFPSFFTPCPPHFPNSNNRFFFVLVSTPLLGCVLSISMVPIFDPIQGQICSSSFWTFLLRWS